MTRQGSGRQLYTSRSAAAPTSHVTALIATGECPQVSLISGGPVGACLLSTEGRAIQAKRHRLRQIEAALIACFLMRGQIFA